jgi:hypothetical protein
VNTDRLIDVLSANLQPVAHRGFERAILVAIGAGGVATLGVMLATVGPRAHLASESHLEWSAIKFLFALSVVVTGAPSLVRSARPGSSARALPLVLPFLLVGTAALASTLFSAHPARQALVLGSTAASPVRCLLCIMGFAAIPWIALIRVLREGAPTRQNVCGALAGLVAGGAGAAAYAFTCTSDSLAFIAVWYVAAIALCAIAGALFGERLLRW